MPTLISLESMEQYGIPTVIDGIGITREQGQVILYLTDTLMREDGAAHDLKTAIELAVVTFKNMYESVGKRWFPKKMLQLSKGHGKPLRNKFYREDKVARGRLDQYEAGARNSRRDKDAIKEVVRLALSQLKDEDAGSILKDIAKRIKNRRKKK